MPVTKREKLAYYWHGKKSCFYSIFFHFFDFLIPSGVGSYLRGECWKDGLVFVLLELRKSDGSFLSYLFFFLNSEEALLYFCAIFNLTIEYEWSYFLYTTMGIIYIVKLSNTVI